MAPDSLLTSSTHFITPRKNFKLSVTHRKHQAVVLRIMSEINFRSWYQPGNRFWGWAMVYIHSSWYQLSWQTPSSPWPYSCTNPAYLPSFSCPTELEICWTREKLGGHLYPSQWTMWLLWKSVWPSRREYQNQNWLINYGLQGANSNEGLPFWAPWVPDSTISLSH